MFEVLDAKFGKAKLIVDETVAEMKKIKPIQSEQEFISFVHKTSKYVRFNGEIRLWKFSVCL